MKLKMIHIIVLSGMIIFSFGTGCVTEHTKITDAEQTKITDLRYDFHTGDEFTYEVKSIKKNKAEILEDKKMRVKVISLNSTMESITTKTKIEQITEGNETIQEYTTKMAQNGTIFEIISNGLIIPEIQPELPNTIIYPEKEIRRGESWTIHKKKEGSVGKPEQLTKYNISSTTNYTWLGFKKISVRAGNFECVGIKSETNYTFNRVVNNTDETFFLYTTGEIIGEEWIDINGGFSVKSTYNVDASVMTDLSENFKNFGFEKFYFETPMTTQILSELVDKKT